MTDPFRLPQVFVLPRETGFSRLRAAVEGLGFRPVAAGPAVQPLIDGEPEVAAWEWPGGLPALYYSFNPVARLRLLDVATAPPRLRGVLAAMLHPLSGAAVREGLADTDDRRRLWAIWAAVETERLDLIHDIASIATTGSPTLREEAETALHRLGDLADLRLEALAGARLIAMTAAELIAGLGRPEDLAPHLATPADCESLFVPQIAARLAERLAARGWPARGLTARPVRDEDVFAAPAGAFRWPNEVSDRFPMGYRTIAGWMAPAPVWVGWRGQEPDGGRVQMDGLVLVEGRWRFFPKAFRLVEPLLPVLPGADRD